MRSIFYSFVGAVLSLALGLAATILSFNRYPGKLNLLGRITGVIGTVYGMLFVIVLFLKY